MSKYEITIKENGIEIKTQEVETLFNANGDPVEIPKGSHRVAVGLGHYVSDRNNGPTFDEMETYRAKIDSIVGDNIGESLTTLLIEAKEANDFVIYAAEDYDILVGSQKSVVDMLGEALAEVDKYNALVNSISTNDK